MSEPYKFIKNLSADPAEKRLRVLAPGGDGESFHAMSFSRERIDYLTEIAEGLSGIALKNGAKIPVALPYEVLEQRIYDDGGDDFIIDLRAVTGPVAADAALPALAADFEAAAPRPSQNAPKPFVNRELTIAFFVRQSQQQNFQMFFVKDSNINWNGVEGEDGLNGKMTKIPLRFSKGPFGETTLLIDMPRAAFMEVYNKAKLEGLAELDLRDQTRRIDPDKPKAPKPKAG